MKKENKKYLFILLCVTIALGLFLGLRHISQVYSSQNNSNIKESSNSPKSFIAGGKTYFRKGSTVDLLQRIFPRRDSLDLSERNSNTSDTVVNRVAFGCLDGKFLAATFYADKTAEINLADEKTVFIDNEKLTESGLRYYSKDKSLVLWTEADEQMSTFIQKDGVITERCKFLGNIE